MRIVKHSNHDGKQRRRTAHGGHWLPRQTKRESGAGAPRQSGTTAALQLPRGAGGRARRGQEAGDEEEGEGRIVPPLRFVSARALFSRPERSAPPLPAPATPHSASAQRT